MAFGDEEEGDETPKPAWERREDETKASFDAFRIYYMLPPRQRSIDEAYRANGDQNRIGKRAPSGWFGWSQKYDWVKRAAAYDQHLAKQDEELWEERRRRLREQDWSQADKVRSIIEDALPYARGFVRRQKNVIRRQGHTTTIITEEFDITALALVLEKASKIQRLSTGDSTENINNLSGAALDAAIQRALDEVARGADDDGLRPDADQPGRENAENGV